MKITIEGKIGEGKTTMAQLIIRAIRHSRKYTKIEFKDGEFKDGGKAILTITNFKNEVGI